MKKWEPFAGVVKETVKTSPRPRIKSGVRKTVLKTMPWCNQKRLLIWLRNKTEDPVLKISISRSQKSNVKQNYKNCRTFGGNKNSRTSGLCICTWPHIHAGTKQQFEPGRTSTESLLANDNTNILTHPQVIIIRCHGHFHTPK